MITLLLILIPLLLGSAFLLNSKQESSKIVNIGTGFTLLIAIVYIAGFMQYNTGQVATLDFKAAWLPSLNINFHIGWDGLGAVMMGLTAALVPIIMYSLKSFEYENKSKLIGLILLTQSALFGVFAAKDIFVFYFFFELALIPVYIIANFWGGKDASKVTFKMLVYTIFGSLLMLVAFIVLYMRGQSSDIESIKVTISLVPKVIQYFAFWAFLIAFMIKMPVFPLHTWQPDAYSKSPTPATMLLSGLLSKMGVFGLLRILVPFSPFALESYALMVSVLGIIGLIYGSIIAIQQDSMKRLIAYSSFAHMGIMAAAVMTASVEGIQGAIFQMVAHGFNVVGLFYIAKLITDRTGSRELSALGGLSQKAPKLAVMFMIILLGSVALPLTNGFIGEFLMLKSIFDFNNIIGIVAGLSIILGAVYMLRFFQKTIFGDLDQKNTQIEDLSSTEMWVLVPIAIVVLVTGLFPNLILEISEPFANALSNITK